MISKDQVMPLLMDACPSYRPLVEYQDLLHPAAGHFVDHLWQLHQQNRTTDFPEVARTLERLLIEGDEDVRDVTIIGLLEGIQNVWGNNGTDPEIFARHLLPVSAMQWKSLNAFWDGMSKPADPKHEHP
ncbi:DUF7674 family protein [Brevifollis gellanilyticus]|uniref:DUF7674 domain-containing protein n=1 Tax=Brevifollis gellanilyticus TaxID=748831 RepID=A0A512MI28_9BACT|nr:hypothetical protein [Brevifollis gellanilyticus]GEP46395.1 hypothetical protein BGE01nite_56860 [Brevifollis gellanilyticus]